MAVEIGVNSTMMLSAGRVALLPPNDRRNPVVTMIFA